MQRPALHLVALAATVSLAACGADDAVPLAAGGLPDGHRVVVHDLRVVGPLADVVEVQLMTEQAVIFPVGGPAAVTLQVRSTENVNLARLPFHSSIAGAGSGDGVLGYRGVCGPGWDEDGRPGATDPCPGADPATEVPAGTAIEVPIMLHRRTDTGTVSPGEYDLTVPLDGTSAVEIDLELRAVRCAQGPATTLVGLSGGGEYTCSLD
jgi:hypothetical protein